MLSWAKRISSGLSRIYVPINVFRRTIAQVIIQGRVVIIIQVIIQWRVVMN